VTVINRFNDVDRTFCEYCDFSAVSYCTLLFFAVTEMWRSCLRRCGYKRNVIKSCVFSTSKGLNAKPKFEKHITLDTRSHGKTAHRNYSDVKDF